MRSRTRLYFLPGRASAWLGAAKNSRFAFSRAGEAEASIDRRGRLKAAVRDGPEVGLSARLELVARRSPSRWMKDLPSMGRSPRTESGAATARSASSRAQRLSARLRRLGEQGRRLSADFRDARALVGHRPRELLDEPLARRGEAEAPSEGQCFSLRRMQRSASRRWPSCRRPPCAASEAAPPSLQWRSSGRQSEEPLSTTRVG